MMGITQINKQFYLTKASNKFAKSKVNNRLALSLVKPTIPPGNRITAGGPSWQFDENELTFYNGTTYDSGNDWILAGSGGSWYNNGITNDVVTGVKGLCYDRESIGLDHTKVNGYAVVICDFFIMEQQRYVIYENASVKLVGAYDYVEKLLEIIDDNGVIRYYSDSELIYTSANYQANKYGWFSPKSAPSALEEPRYYV